MLEVVSIINLFRLFNIYIQRNIHVVSTIHKYIPPGQTVLQTVVSATTVHCTMYSVQHS